MTSPSKLQIAGNELRVGCEIETLLSLQDAPPTSASSPPWHIVKVAKFLCGTYEKLPANRRGRAGLHPGLESYGLPYKGVMYESWILTDESTIKGVKPGLYPFELVSPILVFSNSNTWRTEINGLFNGLSSLCALQGNQSCGFHVHLSPLGKYWTVAELKGISRAIIHFERAMAALLPPHRNGSWWAKTHSNNVKVFMGKTVADCLKLIEACKSIDDVVMLMNDKGNRYFAWNFMNLDEMKTGTIEWRQPAAMTTEQGCIAWMELAIAFVQAARRSDIDCTRYPGNVEGLKEFTSCGLIDGASDQRYLNAIFNNTKTGTATLVDAARPPDAELETKVKEDQKKNLMLRKLSEKLAAEAAARRAAQDAAAGGNGGRR